MRKIYNIAEVPQYSDMAERFLFPYGTLNYLLNGGVFDRVTMITSSTDNGKAQPFYSKIQTPKGEVCMEAIKVGDEIFDINGGVQKVVGIFPQGQKQIYRVWTSDDNYTDCVGEHLWTVIDTMSNKKAKVMTTLQLIDGIEKTSKKGYRYALPKYNAVNYSTKTYICDPYILGAYIGNGCGLEKHFSISSGNEDVIKIISEKLNTNFCRSSIHNYTYKFLVKNKNKQNRKYIFTQDIIPKELVGKKSKDKFIPKEYLQGDIEQRLSLLRGLMDTDGNVHNSKDRFSINTSYSTTSERLAKDVCLLVQSLGFFAKCHKVKRYNRDCNPEFVIYIRIDDKKFNPFLVERKALKWRPPTIFTYRKIKKIESLNELVDCQCIKVSADNELYLTDNFIVTHNTTLCSDIIRSIIEQGYKVCAFFGEDTPRESRDRIYRQATEYTPENIIYKPYVRDGKQTNCGEYFLSEEAYKKAEEKFKDKLFLYNTNANASVDEILEGFKEAKEKHDCKVFVIDNVEQFEFSSDNENKAIKDIVIKIRDYAINNKVHIFLVAHLRKTERDVVLPDLNDVKGTSAMVNIAKNVLIVLRMDKINHDTKQYKELKKLVELNNYDLDNADCLIKVAKTKGRKLGFVCLKFNRITNTYYECKKIDDKKEEEEKPVLFTKQKTIDDLIPIDDDSLPF